MEIVYIRIYFNYTCYIYLLKSICLLKVEKYWITYFVHTIIVISKILKYLGSMVRDSLGNPLFQHLELVILLYLTAHQISTIFATMYASLPTKILIVHDNMHFQKKNIKLLLLARRPLPWHARIACSACTGYSYAKPNLQGAHNFKEWILYK